MEPNDDLKKARRGLHNIRNFELLEDFIWHSGIQKWVLKFRLTGLYIPTPSVPLITEWYCMVSPVYPWGKIDIYPSTNNGITHTFPHQSYNTSVDAYEWRTGNICVSTSVGLWGKKFFNQEPYESETRLNWHVQRCKDWLEAAASNTLLVTGDPFEMPSFPQSKERLFAFNEHDKTFQQWQQVSVNYGLVNSIKPFDKSQIFAITSFNTKGADINYEWGKHVSGANSSKSVDIWVLLKNIPVLPPWQMPTKWNELFRIAKDEGTDLKKIIGDYIFKLKPHPKSMLIGFPVSEYIGGEVCRIYWLAADLPKVPAITNGFRNGSPGMLAMQINIMFKEDAVITWVNTESWNKLEISSRGKLDDSVTAKRFAVIGAGAIGANLTEMLLRLGCYNITIIDKDTVEIGNLARHTLTMDKVWQGKAQSVAEHLNLIFPGANVNYIAQAFDYTMQPTKIEKIISDTDIFIDATGDDSVIHFTGELLQKHSKTLISISTGFAAKRLFCFMQQAVDENTVTTFKKKLQPWLEKDAAENPDPEFPREGIGCWHPVFPARIDDIMMLLSPVIQKIDYFLKGHQLESFFVIEKNIDGEGLLHGIDIIENQ